ncbi:MAG: ATP-dependent DNA helicase RecG [bacterium]|nr:ATP-dependent DNA helicase RecG [bacterium]
MKPEFSLQTSVQFLKSVGPARFRGLSRLGLQTVGDLLDHFPHRYFDRSETVAIGRLVVGKEETILAEVLTTSERRTRRGGSVQTVTIGDDTGVLYCIWFNMRFLLKQFRAGQKVMVSGLVQRHNGRLQLTHPDFEKVVSSAKEKQEGLHTGRIVPVYGLTAGIGQHWLRALVFQALTRLDECSDFYPETIPVALCRKRNLCSAAQARRNIHFPATREALVAARSRLKYEEGFFLQLFTAWRRLQNDQDHGIRLEKPGDLTRRLVDDLPFDLTGAQRRVLSEVLADFKSGQVMHRLVQGDVGCGKTLVAFIACLFVVEQGYQAVMMAPTEVLARQHGLTLRQWAEPLNVSVETLTGSTPAAERRRILSSVAAGEIDLLVGTHAVIQDDVRVPRLALSVIDEQHRFGVRQRGKSTSSGEIADQSHVLVMSATPIPRSLALTLYGDLDLSLIDEIPSGRGSTKTEIIKGTDENKVWQACRRQVEQGHQVFVVHPVIEETEGQDLKAATVEFERLSREAFPEWKCALLHGRLKSAEKQEIMARFAANEYQVLVATTVIEVGIDVPNATVMVVQNPERFGLAQLHQLRGRIGRGKASASCYLLCDGFLSDDTYRRIRFFADNHDGFTLAEEDLRIRGPGESYGTRQHGAPGFRLLCPLADAGLIHQCHQDSRDILQADPGLKSSAGTRLKKCLDNFRFANQSELSG